MARDLAARRGGEAAFGDQGWWPLITPATAAVRLSRARSMPAIRSHRHRPVMKRPIRDAKETREAEVAVVGTALSMPALASGTAIASLAVSRRPWRVSESAA